MKLCYSFELMELDDEFVAVPVGENASSFRGVIKLNEPAAEIFNFLKVETTVDELVNNLLIHYDSEKAEIKKFVVDFVEKLICEGIVE